MRLEYDLFRCLRPDRAKLLSYGFVKEDGSYVYREEFAAGDFTAVIRVDEEGTVYGEAVDVFTGDPYALIHQEKDNGSYSASVREAYLAILAKIAAACFHPVPYPSNQANRLCTLIEQEYGEHLEHPFAKQKEIGVFRISGKDKWYALFMNIDGTKIGREAGEVTVLNVKVPPEKMAELAETDGIHPAYHMNKKNWVSIRLDDTIGDDRIMEYVHDCRRMTMVKNSTKTASAWLIPANPKYFDLIEAFDRSPLITWHQNTAMKKGDTVYIYYGAPYSCILYQCVVEAADLPNPYAHNRRYQKAVRLRKLAMFDPSWLPICWMREHGVSYVRSIRSVPDAFVRAVNDTLKEKGL